MKIATFGAATQDIFLISKKFFHYFENNKDFSPKLCFDFGSKFSIDDVYFFSGGGGTNTAATFSRQGFKVYYVGAVGDDYFGKNLMLELKRLRIDTSYTKIKKRHKTNFSVILSCQGIERVILMYRGASDNISEKDIAWNKIKNCSWFYLSPLSGKSVDLVLKIIDFAQKNKINIALNPSLYQILQNKKDLFKVLPYCDVLILNKEEAFNVFDNKIEDERSLLREFSKITNSTIAVTKGNKGVLVASNGYFYYAPALSKNRVGLIDSTGAGDAFGSGLVAALAKKKSIEYAIQLAIANSGNVITQWGAKNGLLKRGQKWEKVKVEKYKL
jgi:sugar/nucleoside kinase (ribokinase family)